MLERHPILKCCRKMAQRARLKGVGRLCQRIFDARCNNRPPLQTSCRQPSSDTSAERDASVHRRHQPPAACACRRRRGASAASGSPFAPARDMGAPASHATCCAHDATIDDNCGSTSTAAPPQSPHRAAPTKARSTPASNQDPACQGAVKMRCPNAAHNAVCSEAKHEPRTPPSRQGTPSATPRRPAGIPAAVAEACDREGHGGRRHPNSRRPPRGKAPLSLYRRSSGDHSASGGVAPADHRRSRGAAIRRAQVRPANA